MVWKTLPSNTIFFDIETGGFSGYRNSVFSVAYQDVLGKGAEVFAYPEEGTHISQWSRNKVWSRIERDSIKKAIRIQKEKEILSHFLNILETAEEGTTLAGWNIGYQALPQNPDDPRLRGFDISMLMTRAERHGLAGRYEKALSRLQIRDLGQEWASRIAEIVSKPQYEGRVDPKLYESAKGYQMRLYSEGMEGASYEARARWASTSGTKVAGWSQELTHFLKTGQRYEAHGAWEDVTALREMLSYNTIGNEEEFVERWNRAALTDKLVKQARSTTRGTTLQEIQDYARASATKWYGSGSEEVENYVKNLTGKIEDLARASGASLEDVAMGRGMPERWSKVVGRVSAARPAASSFGRIAESVVSHIGQHKVGYGIAVGAAALYAIGPLSLFSGKDDAHNTIEGMQHGGMAERLRQAMTDFGSGYQGITNTIRRWYAQKDEEEREKNRETVKKNAPTPRVQHAQVHTGRGKAYWITRTSTRPNRISGKDDDYNTIEGMPEKGLAGKTRKYRTDFGSGYQGPNPWLQPDYNEKQEVAQYKLMRASQLGKSVSEMVTYFTTKEQPSEYLMATASAGTALHLVEETKKFQSGEARAVEEFVYDPIYKVTGHIDLTRADSGAPVDIKSLAPERMERIRTKGAFPKHVSQLNFYMAMLGQDKGYLEYINRQNVNDRQIIEVPFSQSKLDEDLARLARAREIVEEGIASGKWKEDELPKGASLETLRAQAEEEKGTLAKNAGRLDYLEKVYAEEMEYFHKVDAARRGGRKASPSSTQVRDYIQSQFSKYQNVTGKKFYVDLDSTILDTSLDKQFEAKKAELGEEAASQWFQGITNVSNLRVQQDLIQQLRQLSEQGNTIIPWTNRGEANRSMTLRNLEPYLKRNKGFLEDPIFGAGHKQDIDIDGIVVENDPNNLKGTEGNIFLDPKTVWGNTIPGRDDAYNTIKGLRHGGMAEQMRRSITDFGSGWAGEIAFYTLLQADHLAVAAMGAGRRISGNDSTYNILEGMPHGWFGNQRKNNTDFGSGFLRFLSPSFWKSVKTGLQESPVYVDLAAQSDNFFWKVDPRDYEDVLEYTDIPSKIRSLFNPRNPQRLLHPNIVQESSVAKFRQLLGRNNPTLPANRPTIRIVKEGIGPITNEDIMFGNVHQKIIGGDLQKRPTAILRSSSGRPLTNRDIMFSSRSHITRREDVSASQWTELTKGTEQQGIATEFKVLSEGQIQSPGNVATDGVIPKIQESYNDFTGMPHTSAQTVAERKKHGFKSKWDILRGVVRKGEVFKNVLKTSEFREALMVAEKVKRLGDASLYGEAFLMKGEFRGQQFNFVRKVGQIGKYEAESMRKVQGSVGPSVYSSKATGKLVRDDFGAEHYRGSIDMELFQGEALDKANPIELFARQGDVSKALGKIHKKGILHGDVHTGNIFIARTPAGKKHIGVIDFGESRRLTNRESAAEELQRVQGNIRGQVEIGFSSVSNMKYSLADDPFAQQAEIRGSVMSLLNEGERVSVKTSPGARSALQRDTTATMFKSARAGHNHNTGKKF